MILAGGRGSRLHELTNKVAKPAVSYGGKYRIVDFPLSNCANSGIDVVGVLTQYESILLNSYVAAGRRWGLDAKESGVYVLPPREKADTNLDVYRGTADAISQNIDFIDTYDPEYVLVLSGDHIYKMNYAKMLEESSGMLNEMKTVVTSTSLSMTDKERMDVIDRVYRDVRNQRNLVRYYTNRNIGISYLRAKKKNDTRRVLDLYGTDNQKYW